MKREEVLLTPSEVAALFRVSPKTITKWGDAGKLGRVLRTPGGWRRYYEADVRKVMAGRGGNS